MTMNVSGYEALSAVLNRAYDQAARTKGAERHANALPFHQQPMQTIAAKHGVGFLLGQVVKKVEEAQGMLNRGESTKAVHELLGAINYTAGAVIFVEPKPGNVPEVEPCNCPACTVRRIFDLDEVTVVVESENEGDEDEGEDDLEVIQSLLVKLLQGQGRATE